MNIASEIKSRLKASAYWNGRTKERGKYIQELSCPECGKPEAWCYKDKPFSIICNRGNECYARTPTLDIFPEIISNVEADKPPTKANPNRPAIEYLKVRGLAASIKNLNFEYFPKTRKGCSGGVMFPISTDNGRKIYNGRIFNPPKGQGKTHNKGAVAGSFWKHPGITYDPETETFVCEGIIDALSLIELGCQAIAILAAGQDPSNVDLSEFKKLVFAFDNDAAGQRALTKWKKKYPDASAIMPTSGDWNDLLISGQDFKDHRKRFEHNANLALAQTAQEYAEIYYGFYGAAPKLFEFNGCYYFAHLKVTKNSTEVTTARASNFTLDVDHFILNNTNADEPCNSYYLKIKPQKRRPVSCSVSAINLKSAISRGGVKSSDLLPSAPGAQQKIHNRKIRFFAHFLRKEEKSMQGRKPKHPKIKLLEGNPGKRPITNVLNEEPMQKIQKPDFFDKYASRIWDELAPQLVADGRLTPLTKAGFEILCVLKGRMIKIEEELQSQDFLKQGYRKDSVKNPLLTICKTTVDQFFKFATEYGLTPQSRQRLIIKPSEHDDPFSRFINETDNEKDN
jgi:P27 family predicted phage terminase small subunit